jgi:hypothetical protein
MAIDDKNVSRRQVLEFYFCGTAAIIVSRVLADAGDQQRQQPHTEHSPCDFDLTKGSAALQPDKIV